MVFSTFRRIFSPRSNLPSSSPPAPNTSTSSYTANSSRRNNLPSSTSPPPNTPTSSSTSTADPAVSTAPTSNRPTSSSSRNLGPLETLGSTKDQMLECEDKQQALYPLAPGPGRSRAGPPSPQSSLRRSMLVSSSPVQGPFELEAEPILLRASAQRRVNLVTPGSMPESRRSSFDFCDHGDLCEGGCAVRDSYMEYAKRASVHGSVFDMDDLLDEEGARRIWTGYDSVLDNSRHVSGQSTFGDKIRDVKGKGRADPVRPIDEEGEVTAYSSQDADDISNIAKSFSPMPETPQHAAGIEIESMRTPAPPGYEAMIVEPAPSPEAGPLVQRHRYPSSTYEADFYDPILDARDIGDESSAFAPALRRDSLGVAVSRETVDNGEGPSGTSRYQQEVKNEDAPAAPTVRPYPHATPPSPIGQQQTDEEQDAQPKSISAALRSLSELSEQRLSEQRLSSWPFRIPPISPFHRPDAPRLRLAIPQRTYTEAYQGGLEHDQVVRPLKVQKRKPSTPRAANALFPIRRRAVRGPNPRVQIPQASYTEAYQGLPNDRPSLGPQIPQATYTQNYQQTPARDENHGTPTSNPMASSPPSPPWSNDTPQTVVVHRNVDTPDVFSSPLRSANAQDPTPPRLHRSRGFVFGCDSSPFEFRSPVPTTPQIEDTPNWNFIRNSNSPATPETPTPMPRQRRNAIIEIHHPTSTTHQLAVPAPVTNSRTPIADSFMLQNTQTTDRRGCKLLFVPPVHRSNSTAHKDDLNYKKPTAISARVVSAAADSGYVSKTPSPEAAQALPKTGKEVVPSDPVEAAQPSPEVVEEVVPEDLQSPNWRIIGADDEPAGSKPEAAMVDVAFRPSPPSRVSFASGSSSSKSKSRTRICPVRKLWWKWVHPDKYKLMKENKQAAAGNVEKVRSRDIAGEQALFCHENLSSVSPFAFGM